MKIWSIFVQKLPDLSLYKIWSLSTSGDGAVRAYRRCPRETVAFLLFGAFRPFALFSKTKKEKFLAFFGISIFEKEVSQGGCYPQELSRCSLKWKCFGFFVDKSLGERVQSGIKRKFFLLFCIQNFGKTGQDIRGKTLAFLF